MSNYEIYLLTGVFLLLLSVLTGFSAVTNRRPVVFALVMFVMGGFALYSASTQSAGGNMAADIPVAVFKLYATIMN